MGRCGRPCDLSSGAYRSSRFLLNVAKKLHGVPRATVLNGQPATVFVDGDTVVAALCWTSWTDPLSASAP